MAVRPHDLHERVETLGQYVRVDETIRPPGCPLLRRRVNQPRRGRPFDSDRRGPLTVAVAGQSCRIDGLPVFEHQRPGRRGVLRPRPQPRLSVCPRRRRAGVRPYERTGGASYRFAAARMTSPECSASPAPIHARRCRRPPAGARRGNAARRSRPGSPPNLSRARRRTPPCRRPGDRRVVARLSGGSRAGGCRTRNGARCGARARHPLPGNPSSATARSCTGPA